MAQGGIDCFEVTSSILRAHNSQVWRTSWVIQVWHIPRRRIQVFMAHPLTEDEAMHTTKPSSPMPANSSNAGPPDGSGPDLDRMGGVSSTLEDKVNEILLRACAAPGARAERLQIRHSRSDAHQRCGRFFFQNRRDRAKRQHLAARIFALEAGNGSASGVSGSPAGSCPLAGDVGGSTATGPGDNWNLRRNLETNLDDENSRSAVLLRFTCAQSREGVSAWFAKGISELEKDYEVKRKSGSMSLELSLPPKPCASNSWHNTRMMVHGIQSTVFLPRYRYNPCPPVQTGGVSRRWASLLAPLLLLASTQRTVAYRFHRQ